MGRIRQLDALRGIAAVAVVLFHYVTQYPKLLDQPALPFGSILKFGGYGVDLFFMISGFVVTMSLAHAKGLRSFLAARFVRLYPAYCVAALVTFVVCSAAAPASLQVGAGDLAANMTMLQGLLGFEHVDGAYWSLQIEWLFYVSVGLLAFVVPIRRPLAWLSLWLICAMLTQIVPWQLGAGTTFGKIAGTYLALKHAHLFIMGAAFSMIWTIKRVTHWPALLIVACLAMQFAIEGQAVGLLTLGFASIFLAICFDRLRFLAESPVLLFLGSISYSLYLIHQHNGYVLIRALTSMGMPQLLAALTALGAAIGAATFLNRYVEEPAARLYRRRLQFRKFAAEPAVV